MTIQPTPAHARLDDVEAGLDAIEAALARLDAGQVDEAADEAPVDGAGADVPAGVDTEG